MACFSSIAAAAQGGVPCGGVPWWWGPMRWGPTAADFDVSQLLEARRDIRRRPLLKRLPCCACHATPMGSRSRGSGWVPVGGALMGGLCGVLRTRGAARRVRPDPQAALNEACSCFIHDKCGDAMLRTPASICLRLASIHAWPGCTCRAACHGRLRERLRCSSHRSSSESSSTLAQSGATW